MTMLLNFCLYVLKNRIPDKVRCLYNDKTIFREDLTENWIYNNILLSIIKKIQCHI